MLYQALVGILFLNSRFFDDLDKRLRAAVDDGDLGTVDFHQAIVDAHSNQRRQDMFDRADLGAIVFERRTPGRIGYQITISLDDRLARQVNPLELEAEPRIGGFQRHVDFDAGM